MSLIRVGVIGLGYWGPVLARNFATHPMTRLAALVDSDPEKLKRASNTHKDVAVFTDFRDMLDDVDMVAIATPVSMHYPIAKECIEAGKHIFLEKPMARTSAEALQLVNAADEKGVRICVDHILMYTGIIRLAKEIVDSGELGDILYFNSIRANLGKFQKDVDVVWDLGPHEFSQLVYLLGEPASILTAAGTSHFPSGLVDDVHLHFSYGANLIASTYLSWLSPFKQRITIIGGSRKMLSFSDLWAGEEVKIYDRGAKVINEKGAYLYNYHHGGVIIPPVQNYAPLRREIDEFVAAIREDAPLTSDGRMGLNIAKMLEECEANLYENNGE